MSVRVGIFQGERRDYSTGWRQDDEFDELRELRELGRLMGFADGNLLRQVVEPGQNVVVKPNWVLDRHPHGFDNFGVLTHSAVLRAVVDLVYEALRGDGTITIADAPQWNCDFERLLEITEVEQIAQYYRRRHDFEVRILDLRQVGTVAAGFVMSSDRVALAGDPAGYAVVDLGPRSAFIGMPHLERIYGADYDRAETRRHHNESRHEYLVSKTVLGADTVVHVPKLKVHKKVGVTLNAKGMVGINGNKNWIAHYRVGPPSSGGDEFPDGGPAAARARKKAVRLAIDHLLAPQSKARERAFTVIRRGYRLVKPILGPLAFPDTPEVLPEGGNWHGNDTAWRMTADLARAVMFAGADGVVHDTPQRRFYSVVDGIVAGEREGPLASTPKPCGVFVCGDNLLAVDLVATRLMGFRWERVKSLQWLVETSPHDMGVGDPSGIETVSNVAGWERLLLDDDMHDLAFVPHPNWVGHLEIDRTRSANVAG